MSNARVLSLEALPHKGVCAVCAGEGVPFAKGYIFERLSFAKYLLSSLISFNYLSIL